MSTLHLISTLFPYTTLFRSIAFLAPKRPRERRNVRERAVDAPLLGRVRIHRHPRAELFGPVVDAPALGVRNEITLFRGVALDETRTSATRQRGLQRVVSHQQAAPVRDEIGRAHV